MDHPPTRVYMPPPSTPVGVHPAVHAPRLHHAGAVHTDGLLGTAVLSGGPQVVGMVQEGVTKRVFSSLSVINVSLPGAIPGVVPANSIREGIGLSRS